MSYLKVAKEAEGIAREYLRNRKHPTVLHAADFLNRKLEKPIRYVWSKHYNQYIERYSIYEFVNYLVIRFCQNKVMTLIEFLTKCFIACGYMAYSIDKYQRHMLEHCFTRCAADFDNRYSIFKTINSATKLSVIADNKFFYSLKME